MMKMDKQEFTNELTGLGFEIKEGNPTKPDGNGRYSCQYDQDGKIILALCENGEVQMAALVEGGARVGPCDPAYVLEFIFLQFYLKTQKKEHKEKAEHWKYQQHGRSKESIDAYQKRIAKESP